MSVNCKSNFQLEIVTSRDVENSEIVCWIFGPDPTNSSNLKDTS